MQQTATLRNSKSYEELDAKFQLAIDLRLKNVGYKSIATQVKTAEQGVRRWFMRGGTCYRAYHQRKRLLTKERNQDFGELNEQLKGIAVVSMLVLDEHVRKKSLRAALEALRMAGFEPVQKLQVIEQDSKLLQTIEKAIDAYERNSQQLPAEQPTT